MAATVEERVAQQAPQPSIDPEASSVDDYVQRLVAHTDTDNPAKTFEEFQRVHETNSRRTRVALVLASPLHIAGHDTPSWQYKEAAKSAEKAALWEAEEAPSATSQNPWDLLGVHPERHEAFWEQYFGDRVLDPQALETGYEPVVARLGKEDRQTLGEKLAVLQSAGQPRVRELKHTPSHVKQEVQAYREMHGGYWRAVERMIGDDLRLPAPHEAWKDATESPFQAERVVRALADLSFEVYVDAKKELSPEQSKLLSEVNELLNAARRKEAARKIVGDAQHDDLEAPVAIAAMSTVTSAVLTSAKVVTDTLNVQKDALIQTGAGASDDGMLLFSVFKGLGKKLRDAKTMVAVSLAATSLPLIEMMMRPVDSLSDSPNLLSRADGGIRFEVGAVGIAWLGARAIAAFDGLKLKSDAEQHNWADHLPTGDKELVKSVKNVEKDNPELTKTEAFELSKARVEVTLVKQFEEGSITAENLGGAFAKLKAAESLPELQKLITPPRFPRLAYTRKSFIDQPYQRLLSRAQNIAVAFGVGIFMLTPQVHDMPYLLDPLGSVEGFAAPVLLTLGGAMPRVRHAIGRQIGRATKFFRRLGSR